MSRHRGAKPNRRYELSGSISLLSLEYLLSVERWRFHLQTTGSLSPTFVPARLACLAVKRPFAFTLDARLPTALRAPLGPSVTFWEGTAPVKLPTCHGPVAGLRPTVRIKVASGWYFTVGSTKSSNLASLPPTYPTQMIPRSNDKLQSSSTGSFCPAAGRRHLHRHCNFTGSLVETVLQSLRHSCRSELTRQELRYLRTVIVTAAVYWSFGCELHLTANPLP